MASRCHRSSSGVAGAEVACQPGLGEDPIPPNGPFVQTEDGSNLVVLESGERPQFHDSRLAGIVVSQSIERFVQLEDIPVGLVCPSDSRKGLTLPVATTLCSTDSAGVVDENLTHGSRGHADEVVPVCHREVLATSQPQIRFVDQGGGFQRVVQPFTLHETSSQTSKLVVEALEESLSRLCVATVRTPDQLRQLALLRCIVLSHGCVISSGRGGNSAVRRTGIAARPPMFMKW